MWIDSTIEVQLLGLGPTDHSGLHHHPDLPARRNFVGDGDELVSVSFEDVLASQQLEQIVAGEQEIGSGPALTESVVHLESLAGRYE
ncbi:hypothetical protein ES703_72825 [subsurface metagenome]